MNNTNHTTTYYSLTENNKEEVLMTELHKAQHSFSSSSSYTSYSSDGSYDNDESYYVPSSTSVMHNRYKILDYIGRGHFSSVFKAYDPVQNKMIAIKVYRAKEYYSKVSEGELLMLNYMQAREDSRKKYLVECYGSFHYKTHSCIVFEHLYRDLKQEIRPNKDCKGLGLKRAKQITRNLLKAMSYISELNIIHGDIKPNNIAIRTERSCKIKLLDFGCSQLDKDDDNTRGRRFGTLVYNAPEVTMKLSYNKSVDMWSLGCTVYELVSGKLLFKAKNEYELMGQIIELIGAPDQGRVRNWIRESKQVHLYFHRSGKPRRLPRRRISRHTGKIRSSQTIHDSYWGGESPSLFALLKRFHSADLLDFISKCLFWNPMVRMTPHEALQHPWARTK